MYPFLYICKYMCTYIPDKISLICIITFMLYWICFHKRIDQGLSYCPIQLLDHLSV